MLNLKTFLVLLAVSGVVFVTKLQAYAMVVDWNGQYRVEWVEIDKTSLTNPNMRKSYVLNHLSLSPKIVASDGVNIVSQFEVLPNQTYPDSMLGNAFGTSPGTSNNSNIQGTNYRSSSIAVNQLYLSYLTEYGALLAGRAPLHFGLGMTQNAGMGEFDHWNQARDLFGYKFMIGNMFIMPVIGKVAKSSLDQGTEVTDVIWNVEYSNPETESSIGVFYQLRSSSLGGNDYSKAVSGTVMGGYSMASTNVYLARGFSGFNFKFETGFNQGNTGIQGTNGEEIKVSSYGMLLELNFPRPDTRWEWKVQTGIASGDNPGTNNFEGFAFNRNYDVAFMLFNHPLGKYDLFRTGFQRYRSETTGAQLTTGAAADEEAIGNAVFLTPNVKYRINDHWDWTNSVTYAQLQTSPLTASGVGKDVGWEYDLGLIYKPAPKVKWANQIGILFPGSAFKGDPAGTTNTTGAIYDASLTYGFQTRLSISF